MRSNSSITSSLLICPLKYLFIRDFIISENFSDFTIFVCLYMETWSTRSFFKSSTARFFSLIFAISSKNFGSKIENSVCASANKLMTPSLFMLCFNSSLIRLFISVSVNCFPLPPAARRTTVMRTASKKAASMRVVSSTRLAHRERACLMSRASFIRIFFVDWASSCPLLFSRMKLTAPVIIFAFCRSEVSIKSE